jgi:hypothetical protein
LDPGAGYIPIYYSKYLFLPSLLDILLGIKCIIRFGNSFAFPTGCCGSPLFRFRQSCGFCGDFTGLFVGCLGCAEYSGFFDKSAKKTHLRFLVVTFGVTFGGSLVPLKNDSKEENFGLFGLI